MLFGDFFGSSRRSLSFVPGLAKPCGLKALSVDPASARIEGAAELFPNPKNKGIYHNHFAKARYRTS